MIKSRRYYTGLIYFIVLVALTGLRVAFSYGIADNWTDNQADIRYTLISQILLMGVLPITLYILLVLKPNKEEPKKILQDFDFNKPSLSIVLISFLAGIIFYYLTIGMSGIWNTIITILGFNPIEAPGTIYPSMGHMFFWVLIVGVLPGIFEEITHRGLLINSYKKSSEEEAIIFSALLFGLMHQNIRQVGYAIAGGIILAYFFIKTRSIIAPMIIHFTNNALGTFLQYCYQAENSIGVMYDKFFGLFNNLFTIWILIATWVAAGYALYLILKRLDIVMANKNDIEPTWKKNFKFKYKFNREDVFLYASIILGLTTTIFTYIWGLMR